MAIQVGMARRKYKVCYPTMYAKEDTPDAKTFNCVQVCAGLGNSRLRVGLCSREGSWFLPLHSRPPGALTSPMLHSLISQRAHQNTLEMISTFNTLLIVAGARVSGGSNLISRSMGNVLCRSAVHAVAPWPAVHL